MYIHKLHYLTITDYTCIQYNLRMFDDHINFWTDIYTKLLLFKLLYKLYKSVYSVQINLYVYGELYHQYGKVTDTNSEL